MDEATDGFNTIIGALDTTKLSTPLLLESVEADIANHATIARAFCNPLLLWSDGIKHDGVLLFASDPATYLKKRKDSKSCF